MKKIYYILTIIAAALISCSDDTFDKQQTDSLTIEKAKTWFESNIGLQNLANQMRAPNNDSTDLKPLLNWEMAELDNDSVWSVVELPWEYENGIVQVSNSEVSNYATLQNDRSVIKQVIRLVILQNKKTGDRYGFKMIVVPDLQYMLEKDDAIEQNKYLRRASDLSGTVLFYSVKDEFVNGWKYEAGKITAKVGLAKASEVKWDETKYGASADWVYETITTCYYHHIEQGALKGDLKFDGCSSKTISYYIFDSVGGGGYAPYDSGGGGGGGGGPSTPSTPSTPKTPKTPTVNSDCPPEAAQHSTNVNTMLGSSNADYSAQNVNTSISNLQLKAKNEAIEWGMSVSEDNGSYWVMKHNGSLIYTNSSIDSIYIEHSKNTVLACHTHPDRTLPSPSPSDAIFLGNAYKGGAINIYGNVAFAYNGSTYVVYVNDRNAFQNFCNNNTNAGFFNPSGSMFQSGSIWANDYNTVYNDLINQEYSQSDANSYALSYVLDKYNTGIKVAEKSDNTSSFKEQKTENTISTNNNTTYQPKKCP